MPDDNTPETDAFIATLRAAPGTSHMHITGIEANVLLFLFDNHWETDSRGKVGSPFTTYGMSTADAQNLRDRLMAAHTHSKENDNATK